jgi:hypothetical protein
MLLVNSVENDKIFVKYSEGKKNLRRANFISPFACRYKLSCLPVEFHRIQFFLSFLFVLYFWGHSPLSKLKSFLGACFSFSTIFYPGFRKKFRMRKRKNVEEDCAGVQNLEGQIKRFRISYTPGELRYFLSLIFCC